MLFLTVLEARKSKIKVLADSMSGKVYTWFFLLPSHGGRGERDLWDLLYKSTNPILADSTFMTSSPPKGPPSEYHHMGVRTATHGF